MSVYDLILFTVAQGNIQSILNRFFQQFFNNYNNIEPLNARRNH